MSTAQSARQTSPDTLSKEEKEALLTKKMEEIRKKNEALRKRHEEVEADRKFAESMKGGTVQMGDVDGDSPPIAHRRTPSARKEMKGMINEERKKAQTKPSGGRGRQLDKMAKEPFKASEVTKRMNDPEKSNANVRPRRPQQQQQQQQPAPRTNEGQYQPQQQQPAKRFPTDSRSKQDHRASGDWDRRPQMRQREGEQKRPRPVSGPPLHNRPPPPQSPNQEGGPPPDPVYNFLADRSRDYSFNNNNTSPDKSTDSEKNDQIVNKSRRHPSNFGGANFDNVPKQISHDKQRGARRGGRGGAPRSKMELTVRMTGRERHAYTEWKRERETIDSSRIERQRNREGDWKREWDHDKMDGTDDTKTEPAKRPAGRIGSGRFVGSNSISRDVRLRVDAPVKVGSGRLPSPRGRGSSVPVVNNRGRGRGGVPNDGPNRTRAYSSGSDDNRMVEKQEDKLFVKIENNHMKRRSPRGGHSPTSPRGGGSSPRKSPGRGGRTGSGRFPSHRDQPVFDENEILYASSPPEKNSVRFADEVGHKQRQQRPILKLEIKQNPVNKHNQPSVNFKAEKPAMKKSFHDDSFYNTDEEELDIEQYRLRLDTDGNLVTGNTSEPDTPNSFMTTPVDHVKVLDWAADVEANLRLKKAEEENQTEGEIQTDRENQTDGENQADGVNHADGENQTDGEFQADGEDHEGEENDEDDDDMYEDELVEEVYGDYDEEEIYEEDEEGEYEEGNDDGEEEDENKGQIEEGVNVENTDCVTENDAEIEEDETNEENVECFDNLEVLDEINEEHAEDAETSEVVKEETNGENSVDCDALELVEERNEESVKATSELVNDVANEETVEDCDDSKLVEEKNEESVKESVNDVENEENKVEHCDDSKLVEERHEENAESRDASKSGEDEKHEEKAEDSDVLEGEIVDENAVGAASAEFDNSESENKTEDVTSCQSKVDENIDINAAASAEYIPDDESQTDEDKSGASSCHQEEAPVTLTEQCMEPGASSPEIEDEKVITDEASSVADKEPDTGASGDISSLSGEGLVETADNSIPVDSSSTDTGEQNSAEQCESVQVSQPESISNEPANTSEVNDLSPDSGAGKEEGSTEQHSHDSDSTSEQKKPQLDE